MKVTIIPDDGSDIVILGSDPLGNYISQFRPRQERVQQVQTPTRADYRSLFDRKNRLNTLVFIVDRQHESESDAFAFLMSHADAVPNQALVEVEEADTARWYEDALIGPVECLVHSGRTTVFSYTITAGEALLSKP